MALIKNFTTYQGVQLENAYIKIVDLNINNTEKLAHAEVGVFVSEQYKNTIPLDIRSYTLKTEDLYTLTGDTDLAKFYEYLKSSTEFAGATDA